MISHKSAHNVDQNSSVLYFENTIRYSFWRSFLPWVSPKSTFPKIYVFTNMLITRAPRDPQTWFWRHSTWNLARKKMSYLPRPETHKQKYKRNRQNQNATQNAPPRTPARPCGKSGGRQPPGKTPACSLNMTATLFLLWLDQNKLIFTLTRPK